MTHRLNKAAYALAATALFALPLVLSLMSAPIPDRRESPIDPAEAVGDSRPVFFDSERADGDGRVHEISLRTPQPSALMTHAEIKLLFYQSDHEFPHPVEGYLEIAGTPCRFETEPAAFVDDSRPLSFIRGAGCNPGGTPSGELHLMLRMGGPGALRVYTRALPEAFRSAGGIYHVDNTRPGGGDWPVVMGWYVDEAPSNGLRRANLLAYVWTTSTSAWVAYVVVTGIMLLIWVGIWLFPFDSVDTVISRAQFARRAGAGAAAVAFGLACLYGLFTPPFQAADESHHFASFSEVAVRPYLIADGIAWAKTAHNARIARHQRERFRPQDVGHPETDRYGFEIHRTFERSSLTARVWQVLGRVLPVLDAKEMFTFIRTLYALVFALSVGAAAALSARFAPVPFPQLLVYPFLLVPALPFFGMHFGESALVASISVAFAAIIALTVIDGIRFKGFGLLLGLFAAVFVIGARNSLPMLPMVATLLVLRLIGLRRRDGETDSAAMFWGGFAIGAATYAIVLTAPHKLALLEAFGAASRSAPAAGDLVAGMVSPLTALASGLAGWLLEMALRRPVEVIGTVLTKPMRAVSVGVPIVLIILIVGSFIGSFYYSYPIVESIQGEGRTTLQGYYQQIAQTTLTTFRWTNPSTLLSSSFWTGFGWLDTMPPPSLIGTLVALTGISLIGLLAHIARHRDVQMFATVMILAAGGIVTLAGYTLASYATLTNIHGRYLLGWLLSALAVCWTWPALAARREGPWPARTVWLLAIAGMVHAYAAKFVLQRYF